MRSKSANILVSRVGKDLEKTVEKAMSPLFSVQVVPQELVEIAGACVVSIGISFVDWGSERFPCRLSDAGLLLVVG